ncbi:hypothetical protein NDU88_002259 [Pleurodeles waltl]|uniref:Uncharacterized protein n=1 Tax=Pleurodeles waltl TaxID=8319 RepID=A0AAV7U8R9_PLEWA|nr:hypothetical protein NDU88_002259 [Pleurodeles waltl]
MDSRPAAMDDTARASPAQGWLELKERQEGEALGGKASPGLVELPPRDLDKARWARHRERKGPAELVSGGQNPISLARPRLSTSWIPESAVQADWPSDQSKLDCSQALRV